MDMEAVRGRGIQEAAQFGVPSGLDRRVLDGLIGQRHDQVACFFQDGRPRLSLLGIVPCLHAPGLFLY